MDTQYRYANADVPADLSKKSLVGWVSLIRVTVLDFPHSVERDAFIERAVKNLAYAAFLVRGSKARRDYLKRVLAEYTSTSTRSALTRELGRRFRLAATRRRIPMAASSRCRFSEGFITPIVERLETAKPRG